MVISLLPARLSSCKHPWCIFKNWLPNNDYDLAEQICSSYLKDTNIDSAGIWWKLLNLHFHGLPVGSDGKESACNVEDPGLILVLEDPLEKELAVLSSTLAWRIPWTEEPGGLQSMVLQRVRHTWVITHTHTVFFRLRGVWF